MKANTLRVITLVIIVLSIIISFLYAECHIAFKDDVDAGDIIALLMHFGVVAILIERFTDQIVIKEEYRQFTLARQTKSPTFSLGANSFNTQETEEEFVKKFYWVSFAISMMIAAIGLRYFANVIDMESLCTDTSIAQNKLFVLADVFLTAVLMSGGSRLVLEVIQWFKEEK